MYTINPVYCSGWKAGQDVASHWELAAEPAGGGGGGRPEAHQLCGYRPPGDSGVTLPTMFFL